METNPIKVKPYQSSTLSESLKSLCQKTSPQRVFKHNKSKWTSMPGCTIQHCFRITSHFQMHVKHNTIHANKKLMIPLYGLAVIEATWLL